VVTETAITDFRGESAIAQRNRILHEKLASFPAQIFPAFIALKASLRCKTQHDIGRHPG
jgi:hypothetical protein